jgi:Mn-dependent DtxR family transcriptional regulator
MSDNLRETLLAYFAIVPSACADMVASDLGLNQREVQDMLHKLDDDGFLLMRNSWYRLSERAKKNVK